MSEAARATRTSIELYRWRKHFYVTNHINDMIIDTIRLALGISVAYYQIYIFFLFAYYLHWRWSINLTMQYAFYGCSADSDYQKFTNETNKTQTKQVLYPFQRISSLFTEYIDGAHKNVDSLKSINKYSWAVVLFCLFAVCEQF